ncbi:tyrosine-type recombinase/integrase [Methanoplanus endosymbiosus]|uniref:Tyrosine-type recombinase/integrase n=1 Tax=Methanoplanus endosymbiosus TaxID=33865 RepID=A0A9E7TLF1_9EURY|nr:tyrosine-type recombinase/integrase [Methanoplanus endosymbiosus]UUX93764.1 tyrosine-type recombinase/integrase [Methanoplanus endosymbiosus]
MKLFCDFIQPDKRKDYFSDIKPRRPKVPPKDHITCEDIDLILGVIENLRDKVLLNFMFETGARRSEIVNVRIKDVRIHLNYGEVFLRGKAGERMVEFINSIPDVQEWFRHHKFNKDPDAPL